MWPCLSAAAAYRIAAVKIKASLRPVAVPCL